MAFAQLLGKASAKPSETNIRIPIILFLSLLPDIDMIFLGELYRDPTHSMITAFAVFIPVFVFYSYRAIMYFLASASHSLIVTSSSVDNSSCFGPLQLSNLEWTNLASTILASTIH
jgi:hypothetical protein